MVAAHSPTDLARVFFGHDHWDTPSAILDSILRPHARTIVKACHASSKTFTAADAVLLSLLAGGDVVTTAPTWTQVEKLLWGEIRRTVAASPIDWGSVNQTEISLPSGNLALGLSTNEGVRFQGFHARSGSFLLIVVDEAPGVLPAIFEAISGISAGGDVRQLWLGNPTIASGPFYEVMRSAPGWTKITIDAFDSPNLRGLTLEDLLVLSDDELDCAVRPYLATRRWVVDRYHEWGEQHPLWQARVRGQFPDQAEDALLSLAWLEQAKYREAVYAPDGEPPTAGIDVAGPGEDETVLCVRQGAGVLAVQSWTSNDARGDVAAALAGWKERGLRRVNVDSAGLGHYFAEHLKDLGYEVDSINVGEGSTDKERFANLKAELYWGLRQRLQTGDMAGLTDETAIAQLAGIRYQHNARGQVVIERKEDARKRGVESPDRAEAVMLAFARVHPVAVSAPAPLPANAYHAARPSRLFGSR